MSKDREETITILYQIKEDVAVIKTKLENQEEKQKEFKAQVEEKIKCHDKDITGLKEITLKGGVYLSLFVVLLTTLVSLLAKPILKLFGIET